MYGLDRISQFRSYQANNQGHTQTSYYVYDGHGSTRALTDPSGAVTDTYDYDAFGNIVHSTATGIPPGGTTVAPTPNEFLFAGEQFDSDLNLYYNRARYLNVSTGRFWTMDTQEGLSEDPPSLHKYLYAGDEPVMGDDPSGEVTLAEEEEVGEESAGLDSLLLQVLRVGQQVIKSGKFAAAVLSAIALFAEGDNDPTQPLPLPEEREQQIIPVPRQNLVRLESRFRNNVTSLCISR